jgi:AcrR family transcriptional regulator
VYPATVSTPVVSTKRRRTNTTARLLDAAFEVFAERGYQAASIDLICHRAGFTRGAFYSNYESKDELFLALFDRHASQKVAEVHALTDGVEPEVAIANLMAYFTDATEADRDWYLISTEFTLHAIRNRTAAHVLARHDREFREQLIPLISAVFASAGREPRLDPDQIARTIVAISEGAAAQSYVEPDELPRGTLEKALYPLLFEAIAS